LSVSPTQRSTTSAFTRVFARYGDAPQTRDRHKVAPAPKSRRPRICGAPLTRCTASGERVGELMHARCARETHRQVTLGK
jgi:hypothetical protein